MKVKARPESVLAPQLVEQSASVASSLQGAGPQPVPLRTANLPVSAVIRNLFGESSHDVIPTIFNRNLKMAACQAPRRWAHLSKKGQSPSPSKATIDIGQWRFDRAVLWEALRLQGFGADERCQFSRLPQWLNAHGRRNASGGQKAEQFAEQCVKAMEYVLEQRKANAAESAGTVPDDATQRVAAWTLEQCATFYHLQRTNHYPKWACLWTLKCLAGQVAESLILLDRCLYVKEQHNLTNGDTDAGNDSKGNGKQMEAAVNVKTYVLPVLDHMKSPRNFAVLALKIPKM